MAQLVTMASTIEVLSPAGERGSAEIRAVAGLPTLAGKTIGLLDNNKSNTAAFLELLGRDLVAQHGVARVVTVRKASAAQPAAGDQLEQLRACDAVVTAFAD